MRYFHFPVMGTTTVWYGIVEFNVPFDTVGHFGDGGQQRPYTKMAIDSTDRPASNHTLVFLSIMGQQRHKFTTYDHIL